MSTDSAVAGSVAAVTEWTARGLMQTAQLVFATYVADKQFELAQEYSDRAQAIHDQQMVLLSGDVARWQTAGAPLFDGMIAEAASMDIAQPDYHSEASKAITLVRLQAANAKRVAYECASIHCVAMTCDTVKDLSFKEAALATSAINNAFRREEVDVERRNAIRRDFRAQVVAMARNAYDASNRSSTALAGQYNAMAAQAGQGLAGSLQAIGYGINSVGNTIKTGYQQGYFQTPADQNGPITAYQAASQGTAFAEQFKQYTAVDSSVTQAMQPDYGSDPMAGAKGVSGAEASSAGASPGGMPAEQAYWGYQNTNKTGVK